MTEITGMTLGGWVFISIAWGGIITLTVLCYRKVFKMPAPGSDKDESSD